MTLLTEKADEGGVMVAAIRLECLHDARGVCWACSDQDPRWREWRGGGDPPNAWRWEPESITITITLNEMPCVRCGECVLWPSDDQRQPRHATCKPRRLLSLGGWREWYEKTYGQQVPA